MAALRKRKIQVLAYFMLTWNPELAERHPEWLVVHQPGDKSRPKLEEISDEQKAFMNTVKPEAPRGSKTDPAPSRRAARRGQRISAVHVAVLHLPGGVREGGT